MLFRLVLVVLLLGSSGCYRINYRVAEASGTTYRNQYWRHYYLFGLVPDKESDGLQSFCQGQQLIEIRTYQRPGNAIATVIGGGLNGALTVEGICVK